MRYRAGDDLKVVIKMVRSGVVVSAGAVPFDVRLWVGDPSEAIDAGWDGRRGYGGCTVREDGTAVIGVDKPRLRSGVVSGVMTLHYPDSEMGDGVKEETLPLRFEAMPLWAVGAKTEVVALVSHEIAGVAGPRGPQGRDGSGGGFYNVDARIPLPEGGNYTPETAIAAVANEPTVNEADKSGMIITFYDGGQWRNWRYKQVYDGSEEARQDFANVDNWKEFESGSGGGGGMASRIVLQRITPNLTMMVGAQVRLRFYFDHVSGSGEEQQSTGNAGTATFTFSRGGAREQVKRTIGAGTQEIDITRYCGVGSTSVRLQVQVDTGEQVQTSAVTWTVQQVRLSLGSDLTGYTAVAKGGDLRVSYTLESGSNDAKAISCYVDGRFLTSETKSTSTSNGTFRVASDGLDHGMHTLQIVASQPTGELDEEDNEILLYSNLIYAVFGVYNETATTPIVTTVFDVPDGSKIYQTGETPVLNVKQYDKIAIAYGAYQRGASAVAMELLANGTAVNTAEATVGESATFNVRPMTSGETSYTLRSADGAAVVGFKIESEAVEIGVTVPSGRTLFLDATAHGHANSDSNRDTWTNTEGGITTRTAFEGFVWAGDGWQEGALRLQNDARATIGYYPLHRTTSGGMAFGIKYRCSAVSDEGAKVVSCLDANGNGFCITPTQIVVGRGIGTESETVLTERMTAPGDTYDVAIVVWPSGTGSVDQTQNERMVYIGIDGEYSGGYKLAEGETLWQGQPVGITLGASGATTEVMRVWAYQRALNDGEVLDANILDDDDDVETMLRKVEANDILDSNGMVTPDSLPDGTRIMILTGAAYSDSEGRQMASVLAAAHDNVKSKYFPLVEILTYIKGAADRSRNFVYRPSGSGDKDIRLQGTSSLAYPVKNYRIYTRSGNMFVGIDPEMPFGESGELAEDCTFAMHEGSAPVACWCLKADYAESSSTHNTGWARLTEEVMRQAGMLTPAQKYVDKSRYPYEVRKNVDGEPCILFYRESLSDTPVFLGKYNFNNDKSTEAVYGFTGIPGYHDVAPLNDEDNEETHFTTQQYKQLHGESLGTDLTECYEFRNNEDPMGSFLDDDFDSDTTDPETGEAKRKWTGTFESRYPDKDALHADFKSGAIKPYYLSNLVSWVKSTHVSESDDAATAAAKRQKFRDELKYYFDVEELCGYFALTQVAACVDQMVKNMMLGFWYDKAAESHAVMGKVRGYFIWYDNDSIMAIINNGRLEAPYDVTRQTVQMVDANGKEVYYFAGHESVLWNNLQSEFANEIRQAYVKLRDNNMTNDKIFQYFDREQADKFCARIYNLDAIYKYVAPESMSEAAVAPYRDLLQGSRRAHRKYFVSRRMSMLDNQWRAGEFYTAQDEISYKGISAEGSSIRFALRQEGNVEVRSDVSDDFVKNYPVEGETETTITKATASAVGTIMHVYGTRQMTMLDVSEWDFDQLNLGDFPYLEEFVFNDYEDDDEISGGARMSDLRQYLQTDGASYLNAFGEVLWTQNNIHLQIGLMLPSLTQKWAMGYQDGANFGNKPNGTYFNYEPGNKGWNFGGTKTNHSLAVDTLLDYDVKVSGNTFTCVLNGVASSGTFAGNLYGRDYFGLFASYQDKGTPLPSEAALAGTRVYYFRAWDSNGVLVREMYPVVDGQGVVCMYDFASGRYFYNEGSGEFAAGDVGNEYYDKRGL